MRIGIVSDAHLEHHQMLPPLEEYVDVLIAAGDIYVKGYGVDRLIDEYGMMCRHILYVAGNHEFYGSEYSSTKNLLKELTEKYPENNIVFLDNDTFQVDDITFIGSTAWTDFNLYKNPTSSMITAQSCMNDFYVIKYKDGEIYRKLSPSDTLRFNQEAKEFIFQNIKDKAKTVVITHHAPSEMSIEPKYKQTQDALNPAFANGWEEEILDFGPALWFHGHVHHQVDYMLGDTRVIANPLGYPNEIPGEKKVRIIDL